MTTHERFTRMYAHREADRVPIHDYAWASTIERWRREGLPAGVDYVDHFDLDHIAGIHPDNSPRYERRTIEENDEAITYTTAWGGTERAWKHAATVPEHIDYRIKTADDWKEMKARMTPSRDRINWADLRANYKEWRARGAWIQGVLWFGFDVTHSRVVGTERFLMAMAEQPEWCVDMFNHFLDVSIALLDMVWDEGYTFDVVTWPDDMGYKYHQFFSLNMYRELLKPVHKRAIDWAHAKGIKAHLHSCGDINPLLPELVGIGLDGLNPLEVKAGMDPVAIKKLYGDRLVLHGGINAVHWDNPAAIEAEMTRVMPEMKKNGGYIFASDHSIPSSVSFSDFTRIIGLAKKLGTY